MSGRDTAPWIAVAVALLMAASVALSTVGFVGAAAAQSQQADVVYVWDISGSMDDVADDLKSQSSDLNAQLASSGVDAQYGVVFMDRNFEGPDVAQDLTTDRTKIDDALDEVGSNFGDEDASAGIRTALDDISWRPGSQKVIVVFTDCSDQGDSESRDTAMSELNEADAYLVSVSPPESGYDCEGGPDGQEGELKYMAEERADNGAWADIGGEFSQTVKDIIGAIEEATGAVDQQADPEFEVTNSSVENTTLYLGESTNVTVVVENTGAGSGEYNALISDSTGENLLSEQVSLGPGETERFTVEVSYDDVGSNAILVNHDVIDRIDVVRPPLDGDELEIRDASVNRSTVVPGQAYEVSAVVESTADWRRTAHVRFTHSDAGDNGSTVADTDTLSLAPGESSDITHTVTVPADASGINRTWKIGNESTGTVSILSADDAGSGVAHTYSRVSDDGTDELVTVVRNGGNETRAFGVNLAAEDDALGVLRIVTLDPGEVVELRFGPDELPGESGAADTWWINGEQVNVTADG